jgi:hypothetical protein
MFPYHTTPSCTIHFRDQEIPTKNLEENRANYDPRANTQKQNLDETWANFDPLRDSRGIPNS